MFDNLSQRLGDIFERLKKRGALSEADVDGALREIRIALLEADVALEVVKDFIAAVRTRAVGAEVVNSVTPGQMVVKIVHEQLVEMLHSDDGEINLAGNPPVVILMVGLQGSGKTTTTAKLGRRLDKTGKKKVLMASLDVYRPAAQQQLALLGEQAGISTLPLILGEQPRAIARRALDSGRREGFDVVILDTAGRLHIDTEMMAEISAVSAETKPVETLLVVDAMTGQDAVNVAGEFHDKVGVTGIVLSRVDGDARGGAALSMKSRTGCPLKFMGVGEKLEDLEIFNAERVAGSILGMGDIVGLVEKASQAMDVEQAEKMAAKMAKGRFTLEDMSNQLGQLRKMGNMQGLLGMIPGLGKMKKQIADANIDDRMVARQQAIIQSMTIAERNNSKILNGSRRRRIAAGAGTSVQEVNRLLKQFKQMSLMMKKMGKKGKKNPFAGGLPPGMMPPGTLPPRMF